MAFVRDTYKANPEKKKASVRDSYKADPERRRPLYATANKADPEKKKASRYQDDLEKNRSANMRTIQLPLRHLKGIGIGMTPLSDWLNVLPRGSGIAGVTELPPLPKDYVRLIIFIALVVAT
eukprot:Em0001g885a